MTNIKKYNEIMAAARTYLGLSVEQVAAVLNVDYRYIMALEEGWLQPTEKDIKCFEKLYGIDFEEEFKWQNVEGDRDLVGLLRFADMLGKK